MNDYVVRPLDGQTWDAFADLAAKHNEVWGGCWCTWFHERRPDQAEVPVDPRTYKERLVREGRAHAADYRLTCFFVDRDHRRQGVAGVALAGALGLIAAAGGGGVEGYPQDTQGAKASGSFLYDGTRSLFEQAGFTYERPKGKGHCVMRRTVSPTQPDHREPVTGSPCLWSRAMSTSWDTFADGIPVRSVVGRSRRERIVTRR